MADLPEQETVRVKPPSEVFSGRYRHPCMACGEEMVVPDPSSIHGRVEDGDIWSHSCGALHEYYIAYGSATRGAVVRLLSGVHVRAPGEPDITEFLRKEDK